MSGYISKLAYSYNLPYNCQLYCEIPGVSSANPGVAMGIYTELHSLA
jgi:hypothetical protein